MHVLAYPLGVALLLGTAWLAPAPCHSVDVSPDGRFVVSTSMGTDLRIWEIATGTFHRRLGGNNPPRR